MSANTLDHQSVQRALDSDSLWVLVRVAGEHLVLPSATVMEMVRAPTAHLLPFAPPAVRGVAPLRGQVGLVIDMRTRLGLESNHDEQAALVALLHAREQDHLEWLNDLQECVRERRAFTRTLDPHACAFGRWFDQYKAPTLELEWHLKQFAVPHAQIHAVGATAMEHMNSGRHAEAASLIDHTRGTVLARLVELFEGARRLVTSASREIAVIVNANGRSVGLAVDEVEGIDHLKPETLEGLPTDFGSADPAIVGTARTSRDDRVVVVVDLERLVQDYSTRVAG